MKIKIGLLFALFLFLTSAQKTSAETYWICNQSKCGGLGEICTKPDPADGTPCCWETRNCTTGCINGSMRCEVASCVGYQVQYFTCPAPTVVPGGCNADCTSNAQCGSGLSCSNGKCDGASCNTGGACSTGWCATSQQCSDVGGTSLGGTGCTGGDVCCDAGGGACVPDCSPACGQGDGCGGRCNNADDFDHTCSGLVRVGGQPSTTRSYASNNPCENPPSYKACYSRLNMTFFDATLTTDCSLGGIAAAPKIPGVEVSMRSNNNNLTLVNSPDLFTGISNSAGVINFDKDGVFPSADDPRPRESYVVSYAADASKYVVSSPRIICDQGRTRVQESSLGDSQFSFLLGLDNNVHPNNPTNRVEVGLVKQFGSWFQVEGGNVFGRDGIFNEIPSTCIDPENRESCGSVAVSGRGTRRSPYQYATPLNIGERDRRGQVIRTGMVNVARGAIDLGTSPNAVVSVLGDNATSGYEGARYDFSYFSSKMARLPRVAWNGSGLPSGSDNFLYESAGNITLPFDHVGEYRINSRGEVLPTGDPVLIVILHQGDITIDRNLIIPPGSFLGIIASGKVTIAPNVTEATGVFVADVIDLPSGGNTASEQQFQGNGTFVGWNGVLIGRDLGIRNNRMPTARFAFRADFPINAPEVLRSPQVSWREVAP